MTLRAPCTACGWTLHLIGTQAHVETTAALAKAQHAKVCGDARWDDHRTY